MRRIVSWPAPYFRTKVLVPGLKDIGAANTPVEYIFKMDGILKGQLYCEFSDLMERLFVDATEEAFMDANNAKQEEIISNRDKHVTFRSYQNIRNFGTVLIF